MTTHEKGWDATSRRRFLGAIGAAVAAGTVGLAIGAKKSVAGPNGPVLQGVSPSGAINMSGIDFIYDEPIDSSTVTSSSAYARRHDNQLVHSTQASVVGGYTVRIVPTATWEDTQYDFINTTAIQDTSGRPLVSYCEVIRMA